MTIREETLTGEVQGSLLVPEQTNRTGVVVLTGSSGRVDVARASLFAAKGSVALALRWFGGEGQNPIIHQVPLEVFARATDRLFEAGCSRIGFIGTSRGAEAALLAAIDDSRIDVVAAISPTSAVWMGDGWPPASSWTSNGISLPFVHYDVSSFPTQTGGPLSYRRYFERSLERFTDEVPAATIAIEKARAQVILVAGGDDALWPSEPFARALAQRLEAAGKPHALLTHPKAGHRVLLPGETTPRSTVNAHGGTDEADRELGIAAWKSICDALNFEPDEK